MSYEKPDRTRSNSVWIVIMIVFLGIGAALLWWSQTREAEKTEPVAQQTSAPTNPQAEFTTAPEGGVEVDLPETVVTNVPAEETEPNSRGDDTN